MTNLSLEHHQSSPSLLHKLDEVAALANCSPHDLLRLGESGTIRLYTTVPEGIVVFDIDDTTRMVDSTPSGSLERRALIAQLEGYEPNERKDIELLILSNSDCSDILVRGNIPFYQSLFMEGGRFINKSVIETVSPPSNKPASFSGLGGHPSLCGRLFATYLHSQRNDVRNRFQNVSRSGVELSIARLFVGDSDLRHILKSPVAIGAAAPASLKPKKRSSDDLSPLIREALETAKYPDDNKSVWLTFKAMAEADPPRYPLVGVYAEGVDYDGPNRRERFTYNAFGKRLKTLREAGVD